ncbi:MAG: hypothetical protein QM802_13805 [Agriterribacter sp.]
MRTYFTLLTFLLSSLGCNKNEHQSPYLKCRIAFESDINCGKPVLDFSEDSAALRKFLGTQSIGYIAIGLPQNLNIQNKLLYLSIRETKPEEATACITLGPSYRSLTVIDAKAR